MILVVRLKLREAVLELLELLEMLELPQAIWAFQLFAEMSKTDP